MKQRWVLIILLSLLCVVVFSQVAITLQVFSVRELPLNFVAAFLEAVITAVITVVLLTGQSAAEEVKERNVKVFEKKSELFLKYIDALWEAAEDQTLTAKEYEGLRKDYSVRLMIYLKEKSSAKIAEHLQALGKYVDSPENVYDQIKEHVFEIINVLSDELNLGGRINLERDKALEKPIFPILFKQAVLNEFNRALKSQELNEGAYCTGEALIEDGGMGGEYLCFDFRRFKGCKLIIGPFSKYGHSQGGLWMWLFVEPDIHEIDRFRWYAGNSSLIKIRDGNGKWVDLTGFFSPEDDSYTKLGEFKRPDKENWGGLLFDDPDSLETYGDTYKKEANVLGKRAKYWFKNGQIQGQLITEFLNTYLGEALLIKDALVKKLNWYEYGWNRAVIGQALNDEIFMGYERGTNWLGFARGDKSLKKWTRSRLELILNQPEFQEHFGEVENNAEEKWVGRCLRPHDFKGKPDEMVNFIVEKCQQLKEQVQDFLLGLQWRDTIREKLINEFGFEEDDNDADALYKEIHEKVALYCYSNEDYYVFVFGFWSRDEHITGSLKETLEEILNSEMPEEYFKETEDWGEPERWLFKQFFIDKYKKAFPNEDIADYLMERCRLLEEKAAIIAEEDPS